MSTSRTTLRALRDPPWIPLLPRILELRRPADPSASLRLPPEPEPLEEPSIQTHRSQPADPASSLSDAIGEAYRPPAPGDSFETLRDRHRQQEALLFPPSEDALYHDFAVDVLQPSLLPGGWLSDDSGFLTLGPTADIWSLNGAYLTCHHYRGRDTEFTPTTTTCPIPLDYLIKQRYTKTDFNTQVNDKWTRTTRCPQLRGYVWTGYTRFKILNGFRQTAREVFREHAAGHETIFLQEEKSPGLINERTLNVEDRLKFMEAKQKELSSFFENEVWIFDDEKNANPDRILRAKFILNWKKVEAGAMRAKARLI